MPEPEMREPPRLRPEQVNDILEEARAEQERQRRRHGHAEAATAEVVFGGDIEEGGDAEMVTDEAVPEVEVVERGVSDVSRVPTVYKELYAGSNILLIGCGGIGAWVAINAVMTCGSEISRLHLFDGDTLESTNMDRLPYPAKAFLGLNKAEALARYINAMERDVDIVVHPEHARLQDVISIWESAEAPYVNSQHIPGVIVFDCTDKHEFQESLKRCVSESTMPRLLRRKRRRRLVEQTPPYVPTDGNFPKTNLQQVSCMGYIAVRGDSDFVTISNSLSPSFAAEGMRDGYDIVPSWAGNVMLPAIMSFMAHAEFSRAYSESASTSRPTQGEINLLRFPIGGLVGDLQKQQRRDIAKEERRVAKLTQEAEVRRQQEAEREGQQEEQPQPSPEE